jgi:hypothetical protein
MSAVSGESFRRFERAPGIYAIPPKADIRLRINRVNIERAPAASALHPTPEVSLRCEEPTFFRAKPGNRTIQSRNLQAAGYARARPNPGL